MEHRSIIDIWPSISDFASDIGVSENTAKQMKTRNSIHSRYWLRLVNAAAKRGFRHVSYEKLAQAVSEPAQ